VHSFVLTTTTHHTTHPPADRGIVNQAGVYALDQPQALVSEEKEEESEQEVGSVCVCVCVFMCV
jgi:hypothetical protein